jgi:hypothetical protein
MSTKSVIGNSPRPGDSLDGIVRRFGIANPQDVPAWIATCPECGGHLRWQLTTSDRLNDLSLDCDNEPDMDSEDDDFHRNHQSDWQPVIERVKAWIISANPSKEDRS